MLKKKIKENKYHDFISCFLWHLFSILFLSSLVEKNAFNIVENRTSVNEEVEVDVDEHWNGSEACT